PLPVGKLPDPLTVEKQLEPVRLGDVDDRRFAGRCRPRLELTRVPEVLEQLAGRIGFTCLAVIGEASSMRRGESPRVALPEVRKDLTGAAEEPSVLGPHDRDLICSRQLAEPLALLGPGFHLP